jgi:hypothetical protein
VAGKSGRKRLADQGCSEANEKRFSGDPQPGYADVSPPDPETAEADSALGE